MLETVVIENLYRDFLGANVKLGIIYGRKMAMWDNIWHDLMKLSCKHLSGISDTSIMIDYGIFKEHKISSNIGDEKCQFLKIRL